MKTWLQILIISTLLSACNSRSIVPNHILKPSKMQDVLWDMVRADQLLSENAKINDSSVNKTTESIKLYQQVFRIHNISKEKFQQSFSYYRSHPGLLKIILDSINARSYNAPTEIVHPLPATAPVSPAQ